MKPLPQHNTTSTEATEMSAKPTGVKKARGKKKRSKPEKAQKKGPKRSLNSWIAYRKFYNQMLSPRTPDQCSV